jgi:hypothetical protein
VKEGQIIYKAYGPALLVQEKDEASNVLHKRAEFIKNELYSIYLYFVKLTILENLWILQSNQLI